ncbi:dehydrogenase [Enterococcus saigonensis]|uniref:Dehydrogenase n=1 Tax=Enterococcus saigonensis TaxID=1805431 RepID=A0A679IDI5_9ENTE|nr:Gfo/Idh/MocA family oxidoreductase [Enterococcus saigonensis]BCA86329.1 dehydrogenase [Enterococcus saigonensis]
MRIGVIGIGNIAQKAYLPTYLQKQDEADFYFATRNQEVRRLLKTRYRFQHVYQNLAELMTEKIEACLIHSATKSHYDLVKTCLENGIHVFIDKPLTESYQQTEELYQLAAAKNLILMLGFNRRYAPLVKPLKELSDKRQLHLQKNRIAGSGTPEFLVYDLFLHLVDTAVYLMPGIPKLIYGNLQVNHSNLEYATMLLATETTSATLTMDLRSGANYERYEVTSPSKTLILENLTDLTERNQQGIHQLSGNDWQTTLSKRGFETLVTQFLNALTSKKIVQQEKTLLSHQLCAALLANYTNSEA